MIRKFAFAATAALIAAAALSPTAALAGGGGGGGGKHKFFKPHFKQHFVHAPIVYHDPCYVTKWFKTPFGFQKKVIFVCY